MTRPGAAAFPAPALRWLHLAGLGAFAISQPLFDLLARHTEFLVAHRLDRSDLLGIALLLGIGLPGAIAAVLTGITALAGRLGGWLHLAAIGAGSAFAAVPFVASLPPPLVVLVGCAVAALAAGVYAQVALARRFATLASVALVLFPVVFLWRVLPVAPGGSNPIVKTAGVASDAPVVVVVFDALPVSSLLGPAGSIDARRLPHFARLSDRSHWFRRATTVAERTTDALPALLTGRYPRRNGPATFAEHPQNLFALLSESHVIHAVEPFTALCPPAVCRADAGVAIATNRWSAFVSDLFIVAQHLWLPGALASELPDVTATWRDFAARGPAAAGDAGADGMRERRGDVHWTVDEFLSGISADEPPTLHFLHLSLPHRPYRYLPGGSEYGPVGAFGAVHGLRKGAWLDDPWQVSQALQRHLLQLGFADAVLGRIVAHLEAQALHDRALVVVAADHGVSFRAGHSARQVGPGDAPPNAADILAVPLFVKLPAQREGVTHERPVETIDLLPTLLNALGGSVPKPIDGIDALGGGAPRTARSVYVTREAGERRVLSFGADLTVEPDVLARLGRPYEPTRGGDLFKVGPHPELVGLATERLGATRATGFELALAEASAFDAIDPGAAYLPAQVAGELRRDGLPAAPLALAIAVGGTIRATTRSYGHTAGSASFTAMVPPSAFVAGRNRVEVFLVRAATGSLALEPTTPRAQSLYSGITGRAGELAFLHRSDGRLFPVAPEFVEGSVERDGAYLQGTARDVRRGGATDALLLFAGTRLVYVHPLALREAGGADRPKYQRFRFPLPSAVLEASEGPLRAVALTQTAAAVLPFESGSSEGIASRRWLGDAEAKRVTREGLTGLSLGPGSFVPVQEPARGRVEVEAAADELVFIGRVPEAGLPDAMAVFVADRLVEVEAVAPDCAAPGPDRPLAEPGPCAFRFGLSARHFASAAAASVRVFAFSQGGVYELRYGPSALLP